MRVKIYVLTGGGAADGAAFAALQASTANTPLTLTAAATGATLLATPRELTFTSAADLSAVTYRIVGKDRWGGNPITEDVVGPNANTITARKVYSSITSITPLQSSGSTVSVGYPQRVVTPWVVADINRSKDGMPTSQMAPEIVSGAPTCSYENTYSHVTEFTGDGAYIQSSDAIVPPAVGSKQGTAVRGVITSAAGSIRFRFPRIGSYS